MSIWWMIGAFALILTPIILAHELGHFIAARLSGVRIEEFGLGFPPRAVKLFERGGTVFSLNWIPLGGFVRPAGEDDPTVPGGLAGATKRVRFFVLVAGATANFIMAVILLWIAFMIGQPAFDESRIVVGAVAPNSPSEAAGIQEQDVILTVNGVVVGGSTEAVISEIQAQAGNEVEILLERDGERLTVNLVPRRPEEIGPNEGAIGVVLSHPLSGERTSLGPVAAAGAALESTGNIFYLIARAPGMLIRGELSPDEARFVGPVGISQMAGHAAEFTASTGNWFPLLSFAAVINVALGFTNLLPLPALDGGRILFVLIEALRGRRIEPEREGMVHVVGMIFLLGLMILIIIQDIVNPIIPF